MKRKSFDQKQLEENLVDLDIITAEIYIELDLIYKELHVKGKWNDFVLNLDKAVAAVKDDPEFNLLPENYYVCLHYAFSIIDKYDEFRAKIDDPNPNTEERSFEAEDVENMALSDELMNELEILGISVEPNVFPVLHINNEINEDSIFCYCQISRRMIEKMESILYTLRESKSFIFSQH